MVNLGVSGAPAGSHYGAVYFDVSGFFYASNNNTGNIYRIDLRTVPGTNYDETKTVLFSLSVRFDLERWRALRQRAGADRFRRCAGHRDG